MHHHTIVDASSPLKRQDKLPSPKLRRSIDQWVSFGGAGVLLHDDHHDHEDRPEIGKPHESDDFREGNERNKSGRCRGNRCGTVCQPSFESATNAYRSLRKCWRKEKSSSGDTGDRAGEIEYEYQIEKLRASVREQVRRQIVWWGFVTRSRRNEISTLREELETYFFCLSSWDFQNDAVERLSRSRAETEDRSNRVIEVVHAHS